jgi:pyruvate dehydrogenase E2 component (dihydrolipoamide acetyltransferase)
MAEEIFIPKLGQTVEEVTLVKWLLKDGDSVKPGQEILEVETDKAVFAVEATARGVLHLGSFQEGQIIPVLTVVGWIVKPGENFQLPQEGASGGASIIVVTPAMPAVESVGGSAPQGASSSEGKLFASPRARKLARAKNVELGRVKPSGAGGIRIIEKDVASYLAAAPKATPVAQRAAAAGLDLHALAGSGPQGRITKEDVERAAAGKVELPAQSPTLKPVPTGAAVALPEEEVAERIPLKGVRALIAERMGASVHTTARVTLVAEMDATEFVALRERLKARVEKEWGFAPGYNDLLAKVAAAALRKFPYMNARLAPDAIELMAHVNIGLAVETERGLLVPVVHDADRKSLRVFGQELRELVERARKARSLPDDLSGGTFTITNLGMYEIDAFTPVINLPEAAILGVGRITPKPAAAVDGAIVVRKMLTLSLVFDHRLVDGAPAARFLQHIKRLVEEPYLLLAE